MQPPPRKVKLTQEVKLHFMEQLCSLQSKQQRDTELLEDIRSYSKQRSAIEREYGQALQRLASQFLKRDWQRGRSEGNNSRSVVAVWKGIIDGAMYTGQARVATSESYRTIALEASKTARMSKERMLKKGIEQLQKVQAELLETVKELDKTKKQFTQLQRSNEVAKDKAADVEARLRRSDRGIFHTKASLQKLSAKFSAQLVEYSKQLTGVHNEYVLTLVSANAHLDHYYHVELPAVMKVVRDVFPGGGRCERLDDEQALDGDLYERLRDHLTLTSQTEIEICQATQEWFQRVLESSIQISREQNLLLFLQDHAAFTLTPEQRFQLAGMDQLRLLEPESSSASESSLEKEVRRWANRTAKDYKIKMHSEQVLQRLEARRQQAPEAEVAAMERRMEEVKENIRKAEVSKAKADARLALLRTVGLDVDAWLAGALAQALEELERERSLSAAQQAEKEAAEASEEFDLAEFDDYDDSVEAFEDGEPGPAGRAYPYTCRVIFGYQGRQADELSITQGEELEIIEDGDVEEWVKARNKAGQVGYVPEKYLLLLGCTGSDAGPAAGGPAAAPLATALQRQLSSIMAAELVLEPGAWLVRALYDYEGQSPEELSFPEGAIIRVLPRAEGDVDDGFWTGDFNGRIGVFPSLVVEELMGTGGSAGQELPSPSPPPFSPPGLVPSLPSNPTPELLLGAPTCRQDGPASGQSSPDLSAGRLRPLRAPPPPPGRATATEPALHPS